MVVDKRLATFRGIETRALRAMSPDELVAELKRVERELRLWKQMVQGQPRWFQLTPNVRREHNRLQSEKRRIERELKLRAEQMMGSIGWTNSVEVDA